MNYGHRCSKNMNVSDSSLGWTQRITEFSFVSSVLRACPPCTTLGAYGPLQAIKLLFWQHGVLTPDLFLRDHAEAGDR